MSLHSEGALLECNGIDGTCSADPSPAAEDALIVYSPDLGDIKAADAGKFRRAKFSRNGSGLTGEALFSLCLAVGAAVDELMFLF